MKNQNQEEEQQKKVTTRYEQRTERRRIQAEKNAKSDKMFNMACIAAVVVIVAALVVGVTTSVINKNKATSETFIRVGSHDITRVEYDYYYNMSVNNYVNSYGQFLSYMGLDPSQDLASQPYSDTMSWKDAFDQMAVEQLTQTKALADDAAANGFTADVTADYEAFTASVEQAAQTSQTTVKRYYRASFGPYATIDSVASYIREGLLTEAYYNHLLEQNDPSAEDITAYYEENKNNYDTVSYHNYAFTAEVAEDATADQIGAALQEQKVRAEEMQSRLEAGADFRELCIEYAADADKATYETADPDATLVENASFAATPPSYQEWLFEEGRNAGDVYVAEDIAANRIYVIEFVSRAQGENYEETIGSTLAGERVAEYVTALTDTYEVVDLSGELVYLTLPEETITEESAADGTDAADVTDTTEAADETEAEDATEAADTTEAEDAAEVTEAAAEVTEVAAEVTEPADGTDAVDETSAADTTEAAE